MSEIAITILLLGFLLTIVSLVAIASVIAYNRDRVRLKVNGNIDVGKMKAGVNMDFEGHAKEEEKKAENTYETAEIKSKTTFE